MSKIKGTKHIKNSSNSKVTVKRIHNPVTNSYYKLRVRNTSAGKKGTIIGKWSSKSG